MSTVKSCLLEAKAQLKSTGIDTISDAELLLAQASGRTRSWLYAWPDSELTPETVDKFRHLIARRLQGEPVAYLRGEQEFWSLAFSVNKHVLIPRPETELLVEQAIVLLNAMPQASVLEMGTGSGAISIALATEYPNVNFTASDISREALYIARENAHRHCSENIEFVQSSWFKNIESPAEGFDIVISNPPYIAQQDTHLLGDGVKHEPLLALASGDSGLHALTEIIEQAQHYLRDDGVLLLEHGHDQGDSVTLLLKAAGYIECETIKDLAGNDRVSKGRGNNCKQD